MIVYPVRGINEDDEDLDGMIVDASGRALEVAEIVAELNRPHATRPCECGRVSKLRCNQHSRLNDCPNLGEAKTA